MQGPGASVVILLQLVGLASLLVPLASLLAPMALRAETPAPAPSARVPGAQLPQGQLPAPPAPAVAPSSSPEPPAVPQIARDAWKDCAYNGETIGCRDEQLADGLRLIWKDGLSMTYRERQPRRPGEPVYLVDRYGGLWRRELMPQGNTVLTNLRTGNRILVPLRLVCRPPLRGEVGYCHP